MAITHDDLSLTKAQARRNAAITSQLAVSLVVLSVLCGLVSFVLCLAAEASRSEATWYLVSSGASGDRTLECYFNGSGRTPLVCAICAFLLLAVAMFAEHAYMLLAVAVPESSAVGWRVTDDHPRLTASNPASLTWQACLLFLITWICFGLAEILLMVTIGVESGHISDWTRPRPVCHVVRPGVLAAAGILGLVTVFLGFLVYLTALRTQRLMSGQEAVPAGVVRATGASAPPATASPPPPA